ncbi:MAG: two-component system, cell cycle response regulator, partial [Pseudonocardiales bacterium]|nr:two-component system, cell cycle response regulator [Pseudonocardiales bacterium]
MTSGTVLIADDSLVVRAVVRTGLEDEGYRVIEAVDGLTALEECRQEPPDVILLDIEMPGLDGYQVLSELKRDPGLENIPVVFLTSRSGTEDVVAGLRGGAHDYLKKPFEPIELLARVGSAIHVKKLQDQLQQRNAELDRTSRTDQLTGLFNRRHLDEELMRRNKDSLRHDDPVCLLLLDIDHFKHVNDTYGHPVGDQVLREFAQRMSLGVRAGDVAGRWGGEEFLVILARTDLAGAQEVAERIRSATAATPMTAAGQDIGVTVSGGCAMGP